MGLTKILVLDAEPLVRNVISEILMRDGYTVRGASSFREAREVAHTFRPHLLLTNLYLPDTTGHEAAKWLRSECPEMGVLMVTGLPDDKRIQERTAQDEGYDVFPKPFSARELAAKVKEFLAAMDRQPSHP